MGENVSESAISVLTNGSAWFGLSATGSKLLMFYLCPLFLFDNGSFFSEPCSGADCTENHTATFANGTDGAGITDIFNLEFPDET